MPPASTGAVVSMLGGPHGCGPAFQVIWARFRVIGRLCLIMRRKVVLGMDLSVAG